MEFTFLGTSSGVPTKTRNVSGLAIRRAHAKSWCLVDCGEGTQHQLLKTPYSLSSLSAIFITHMHGDHCYGLPGLLASATMSGRTQKLTIVGPSELQGLLDWMIKSTQVRLSYEIDLQDVNAIHEYKNSEFLVKTCPLSHRVPSWAYEFTETETSGHLDVAKLQEDGIASGPIWGKLQRGLDITLEDGRKLQAENYLMKGRRPRKVIIGGDNDTPARLTGNTEGLDVLVHESTYTETVAQKVGFAPQHSYAKLVAQFAESQKIPNLVLTHFSTRYHKGIGKNSIDALEQEAKNNYTGNLFLANDLDTFHLNKSCELHKAAET